MYSLKAGLPVTKAREAVHDGPVSGQPRQQEHPRPRSKSWAAAVAAGHRCAGRIAGVRLYRRIQCVAILDGPSFQYAGPRQLGLGLAGMIDGSGREMRSGKGMC